MPPPAPWIRAPAAACARRAPIAALALLLLAATPHPAALSRLVLTATAGGLEARLTVQELTLREVPRWILDDDRDARISSDELARHWDRVAKLLEESLWLEAAGERWTPEWRVHAYEGADVAARGGGRLFDRVVLAARWERGAPPAALAAHSALFLEDGNPGHRTVVVAHGFGAQPRRGLLDAGLRTMRIETAARSAMFGGYLRLGGEHVLEGWDHLAFLLALMLGIAGLGALVAAVTAFTLAHTLTLAASALDLLRLPAAVVEPGIAASVLFVAWLHLRAAPGSARPWIPAFAFGLLHGCGFAGVLGEIGLPPQARTPALLGFNAGVELGQLAFVVPVALLVLAARRLPPAAREFLFQGAAVAVLAFAVRLVGTQLDAWVLGAPAWGSAELRALAGGGAAATLLALAPASSERARRARVLLVHGVVVLGCYVAGATLAGAADS